MPRTCDCAGGCGPDGVTRREFITLLGVGAGALLTPAALASAPQPPALARWLADTRQRCAPVVYRSETHTDARMPLGGIGTGNFEIGADGQFTTWQLFNTLRDGSVPLFFAARVGSATRLLQTVGGPDVARVSRIEMTGQYPTATLRFHDDALPVEISLSAFSPFAPLDTQLSSLPVACFAFTVHNPTGQAQTVSLAALTQNPIGYDAMGVERVPDSIGVNHVPTRLEFAHPNFGANVNTTSRDSAAAFLSMHARPGVVPDLTPPLHLFTNVNSAGLNAFSGDRPAGLTIDDAARLPETPPAADALVWLEDAPTDFPAAVLRHARAAASAGASVLFSGQTSPLVETYRELTKGETAHREDVTFEDFEGGYERWTIEGAAFGTKPATGTLPNQQPVTGFSGHGLVNSYLGGDDAKGRLISREFVIERAFVRFLIGGGNHPGTQIRLIVGGETVRTSAGRSEERLLPAQWDVRDLRGQTAHLEIVDEQTGPWGHINIDDIVFSDLPMPSESLAILRELLGEMPETMPPTWTRAFGKGRVLVANEAILSASEAELIGARQKAYARLAALTGREYVAPTSVPGNAPGFGTMTLAALGRRTSALTHFENWSDALKQFAATGKFDPISAATPNAPTPPGRTVGGALASEAVVAPGATVTLPFLLAWRYPGKYNETGQWIGCHYAQHWPDADAVARHAVKNFKSLRNSTERFRRALYDTTLPVWLTDCVSSQISTLRHIGVVFRIANGDLYAWEGSNGCCAPTCTHVWGYAQTLARLFPSLERGMRRLDFEHQQGADGGVNNRTDVPSPPHPTGEHPFSDGHASTVLKAYREILHSPDDALLHRWWPHLKRAVDYLIARDAATSPGGQPDGTLADDQWNTYDNAIHGVNSFIGTYYLAALRAGEELAKRAGEPETAERYRKVFEAGRENLTAQCWNGEYFQQNLPDYMTRSGEYGPGCLSDQLLGQWWAHQLDLGYLLPPEKIQSALRAIYKYNWLTDHTNFHHTWRKFAGGTDKGLLVCTWPRGGRPAQTIPYVDEVWTGVEYQVAAHMLYEGMTSEAFAIVKGARERYDGIPRDPMPRNPWSEIECGGHYARALSSWSLLLAASGFHYDGPMQTLHFRPAETPNRFKAFFCGPEGWGTLSQARRGKRQQNAVSVAQGEVNIHHLHLTATAKTATARWGRETVPVTLTPQGGDVRLTFSKPLRVTPDHSLHITLEEKS